MKRWNYRIVLAGLVATVCLCTCLRVQGQTAEAPERETARVSLGTTSGSAGDLIVVPIYFTPAQGLEVGHLRLEVSYVSANLKFSSLEVGVAATTGGVDLHSEVKEAKNEKGIDTQTLQITAASSSESAKKGIPDGLLAYVAMKISESARSARITLRGSAQARELGSNRALSLKDFETTLDVFGTGAQPMLTCFFFSH